jgi:molecular chaperone DnaK (HSP70)
MVLRYAKSLASASAGSPVKDCCITVPPYYSAAERLAILDAARLAGFNPLALINAGTAAAVNHVTKGKLEDKPRYLLVYDIGAVDTSASLFEIKQVNETRGKFAKKNVTVGVLESIGVGWDETLGGRAFDIALARLFVTAIKKQRPDIDVFANEARAWARLVKEAARVKEVLSANTVFDARVEGLVTDYDFKLRVTREEFERACEPLLARVGKPILDAVAQAGINIKDIGGAEVVGGGWRVPAVQERLKTVLGRDTIDQHINGDEGAVMGAAFFGASLAPGFRVKDFKVKDAVFSPIEVKIVSQPLAEGAAAPMADDDEPLDKATELWKAGSRLRSKKTLTFTTARNMTLSLLYGAGATLSGSQANEIGVWSVTGVPNPQTHANLTAVPKVTATLMLDVSGVVRFVKAEAQIEVEHWVMPKAAKKPRVVAANETASAAANETATNKTATEGAAASEEADEEADGADSDDGDESEKPKAPETPKTPGFGAVKPIDAGSALIANSARKDLEAWLGAPLEHFVPIQYATYVDIDGELGYFFKVRTTNVPVVVPDEPAEEPAAEEEAKADADTAIEEGDEAAKKEAEAAAKKVAEAAKRAKELERLVRKLAADTNEYLHVRVNYDPSGSKQSPSPAADATIGEADEDGVARVKDEAAAAPSPNVQVRGVSEKKAAIDTLEYFDENIVPKAQVLKRSLTVTLNVTQVAGVRGVSDAVFSAATASLATYDTRDVEKRARADAKNAVESYCYDMKEKLYDETLEAVTLESERDEFRSLLSDASDWLDIEGATATTKAFQEKLESLRKVGDEIAARVREITEAPKLAEEMRALVDGAKEILANITSSHQVTQEEASGAVTMATDALEWLEKTETEQAALKAHEKRVLSVASIQDAFAKFEKRLKALLKRPKKSKKKAAATKKSTTKKDADKKAEADADEKDADADADAE